MPMDAGGGGECEICLPAAGEPEIMLQGILCELVRGLARKADRPERPARIG